MKIQNFKNIIILAQTLIVILLLIFYRQGNDIVSNLNPKCDSNAAGGTASKNNLKQKTSESENVLARPSTTDVVNENHSAFLRAVRNEVKEILMSLHSVNFAFKTERGHFGTNLKAMGALVPKSPMIVKIGFASAYQGRFEDFEKIDPTEEADFISTDGFVKHKMQDSSLAKNIASYAKGVEEINLSDYASLCDYGCTATEDKFEILVAIPIPEINRVDVWSINEKKEIRHLVDAVLDVTE